MGALAGMLLAHAMFDLPLLQVSTNDRGGGAKMLAEAGLALAFDVPRERTPGGCWSSAAAMGEALMHRLPTKAGITFHDEG